MNFKTVNTVLKAITLAMGVAVVVLGQLGAVDTETCLSMLGIGLACVGVCLLSENGKSDDDDKK